MTIDDLEYKFREEYCKGSLRSKELDPNPFKQFESWFLDISKVKEHAPNAITLATATKDGRPSSRIVLLKHFDERGPVFFTNYNSRKAQEIIENPYVSITLFSVELEREIRIQGRAEKVSKQESLDYRRSRPFESQVAAYVSEQSTVLESRDVLENAYNDALVQFKETGVPDQDDWGGFRITPEYFEFWQGREHRLHDRFIYKLRDGRWETDRLYP